MPAPTKPTAVLGIIRLHGGGAWQPGGAPTVGQKVEAFLPHVGLSWSRTVLSFFGYA
jgi:hypothetical protein